MASFRLAVYLRSLEVQAWNFSDRHRQRLVQALPACSILECAGSAEFAVALAGRRDDAGLAAVGWRFEQAWVDAAADLRLLATPAAGQDYFSICFPSEVERVNGSFHGELMAETALGMLLGHTHGIFLGGRLMREGGWPRTEIDAMARPLRGSHLVIVGFGHIGGWIARLAKPFGVRITGIKRHPRQADRPDFFADEDRILPLSELDKVLPDADHLLLILPGGEDTTNLINRQRLALLPPHAAVYNFGRGNALEEEALLAALQERRIAGAYLDVFAQEPLAADSPLRGLDNAWLLPHSSAIAPNYLDLFFDELVPRLQRKFG